MSKSPSLLLVVDACVARAAGESNHPVSSACRTALNDMLCICHRMAMTPELQAEWNRHAGKYALKWRSAMTSRKKVVPVKPAALAKSDASGLGLAAKDQAAVDKDLHLVTAACSGDGIILTHDSTFESLWGRCWGAFQPPRTIHWVNPVRDGADCVARL